jgi:hypothetical protein
MTTHGPHDRDDAVESDDVRSLLEAGKAEVADYDYERGLATHLGAIAVPFSSGADPASLAKTAAGSGVAGGAAALGGAGAGANGGALAPIALASSKAWFGWLTLPALGATVAAALWFSGQGSPEPLHGEAPSAGVGAHPAATSVVAPEVTTGDVAKEPAKGSGAAEMAARADENATLHAPQHTASSQRVDTSRTRARRPQPVPAADGIGKVVLEEHAEDVAAPPDVREPSPAGAAIAESGQVAGRPVVESEEAVKARLDEEAARKQRTAAAQESQSDRLRLEMEALMEAKHALAKNPSRALSLARDGERTFGKSILSEERQHVLILALIALGRLGEAERMAAPYLQNHPGSPFAKRVQRALDDAKARRSAP